MQMAMSKDENAKIDPESGVLSEEELETVIGGAISTTTQMVSSQMFVRSTLNHFFPLPPSPC
jgi:bacteriocin-like protein